MSFGISRLIVHFPRNLKSARLVVFSHGALKDPIIYRPLLQHITSHGYVVVAPVHDDSVIEKGLLARTANSQGASTWDIDRVLNDVFAWEARTEGCRTVLEHVDRISEACGININAERPVIVGHEFGAYTAQLLLGAVVNDNGGKISRFNDDRWYSGVLMASQGTGIMGLDDQSWSGMTRPLVVVQAALETDFTNQTPQAKIDAFTMSPPGNKHLLWFTRADTTMYTPTRTPHSLRERQQNDDLRASVTAGITAYANYDQNLFSMLASDWPERASSQRILASYR
jgi:hypothetical protein